MRPKQSGIYAIRNTISGRIYVGSSSGIFKRWNRHRWQLGKGEHHSRSLQRSWIKHGPDAFEWTVLERVEVADLLTREQHWIYALHASCRRRGFNVHPVAGSARNPPAETRARMSAAKKGKKQTAEHVEKVRVAKIGAKLAPRTEEHRARLSAAKLGIKLSDATRAKMSAAKKLPRSPQHVANQAAATRGRKLSPEQCAMISATNKGRKHAPRSDEYRAKISAAHKGRPKSAEHRAKLSAPKSAEHKAKLSAATKAHYARKQASLPL